MSEDERYSTSMYTGVLSRKTKLPLGVKRMVIKPSILEPGSREYYENGQPRRQQAELILRIPEFRYQVERG